MLERQRTVRLWVLRILPIALLVTLCGTAHSLERKTWLAVTGMLSDYEMSDVNNGIRDLGIALLGGVFVDDIPVGLGFGAQLGMDVTSHLAVGLDYDRYTARTSGSGSNSSQQTGRVEIAITLPANAISGTLELRHHGGLGVDVADEGRWSVGAGVAGGVLWMNGELKITSDSDGIETTTISGTGPLVEAFLAADIWQSPRLGFGTSLGYRFAKLDSPEMTRSDMGAPSTTLASIDYSGLYLQVAIKFTLH